MTATEVLKRWVKSAVNSVGYDLIQHVETVENPFDVLKLVVMEELAASDDFYFVQIGANDGVSGDPLRELVLTHQLKGLLVEPLPDLFERLRANYESQPGLAFERCAIGRRDGELDLYRVRADASLPRWVQEIASFDRSHLSSKKFGVPRLEDYIETVTVPCLTLPTLLKRHNLKEISLLQIDTEGFDIEIVRMALESGLRPPIINFEYIHAPPKVRTECKRQLKEAGYGFVDVGRDTLAIRQQHA